MQLLENITDYHEFFCGLSPVLAKGGEVYLYKNDQNPSFTPYVDTLCYATYICSHEVLQRPKCDTI